MVIGESNDHMSYLAAKIVKVLAELRLLDNY